MEQVDLRGVPGRIIEAVEQYVFGKNELLRHMVVAVLSGGHVLVEGYPGTAKTLAARSFAQAIGGEFRRVQLTPDLLPGDITGFNHYRANGSSQFVAGPLFANVVMADELNRATPRTQSAFLEAMEERQVTVEGTTHELPQPFLVVGSQSPYGGEGTFQLPDVQMDRFMLRLWSAYPEREEENSVLEQADALEAPSVDAVCATIDLRRLRELVRQVHVSDLVRGYILDIVESVRADPEVLQGPSPRGSLALYRGTRALAFLDRRDYVIPDDVQALAVPALEHRLRLTTEAELDEVTRLAAVDRAVRALTVPRGEVAP